MRFTCSSSARPSSSALGSWVSSLLSESGAPVADFLHDTIMVFAILGLCTALAIAIVAFSVAMAARGKGDK